MSDFDSCGKPKNDYVAGKVSFRDLPPDYPYNLTRNARRLDGLLDDLRKERNNIDLIIKK